MTFCDNKKCPDRKVLFEKRGMFRRDGLYFCSQKCSGEAPQVAVPQKMYKVRLT